MKLNAKRYLALFLALVMVFALTACAQPAAPAAPAADAPAAESPAAEVITMKFGHSSDPSPANWYHLYAVEFERLVEEYSKGAIDVVVYPSSQLGDEQEMAQSVSLGDLESTLIASTNFANFCPAMGFLNLPYMFESTDESRATIKTMLPWLQEVSISESNVRILGISDAGFRQLSTKDPVTCLADMAGMVVRVPSNTVMINFYEAIGAAPTVIGWNETYTALQQGVAVAQDNPYNSLISASLYEVQSYVTDSNYMMQSNLFLISEGFYQGLSDELKAAVDKAAADTVAYANGITDTETANDKARLEGELGMTFLGEPTDLDKWVELGRSTWPAMYEVIGNGDAARGEEIINTVLDYKAEAGF